MRALSLNYVKIKLKVDLSSGDLFEFGKFMRNRGLPFR